MKLSTLTENLEMVSSRGDFDTEVQAIQYDSRKVKEGHLFAALRGAQADGHRFIRQAKEAGAAAIVAEEPPQDADEIPWLQVRESRKAMGELAAVLHEDPSADLKVAGVTGTNGKTTTAFLIQYLLNESHRRCGMVGTVYYDDGSEQVEAPRTTPESSDLHALLASMRENGCRASVMEVSSHGLDQYRVAGVHFDVGVFTNLSQDHLDYHGTMDNYFQAKRKLFRMLEDEMSRKTTAVVNGDDTWGQKLLRSMAPGVNDIAYGFGARCQFQALNPRSDLDGTVFTLKAKGREFLVRTPYIGRFNVYNCLGALAAVTSMGANLREAVQHLVEAPYVPGRMEAIGREMPFRVFVDYAHTPDALEKACSTLRELKPNRLITVFGCGGDRDRFKRPLMAKAAARFSDAVVLTSDNPRTEDPAQIIRDAEQGLGSVQRVIIEDREEAIRKAIEAAEERDIILIAGKGHEDYQEIHGEKHDFDDRKVAQYCINDLQFGKTAPRPL